MKAQRILKQTFLLAIVFTHSSLAQIPTDPGPSDVVVETGRIHMVNPGESVFVGDGSGINIIDWKSIKCNTGVGHQALLKTTAGSFNTGLGGYSLFANEVGNYNTALGCRSALSFDGSFNTALGYEVLGKDSTSDTQSNTAIGYRALYGEYGDLEDFYYYRNNTVIGNEALHGQRPPLFYNSPDIRNNTAVGTQASYATIADENTAVGNRALLNPTRSEENTAIGNSALLGIHPFGDEIWYHIGTGVGHSTLIESVNSTAVGASALMKSDESSAIGFHALSNKKVQYGTAAGYKALSKVDTSSSSARSRSLTAFGWMAGNNLEDIAENATAVGALVGLTADDQVRIGNVAVSSIGGPVPWTAFSDAQFKKDIQEDVVGLNFINTLRPVTYKVDREKLKSWWQENYPNYPIEILDQMYDTTEFRYSGFIAQEVETAAQNAGYEFSGVDAPKNEKDYYGLRYGTFTVPLIKAVQEITQQNQNLEERKEWLLQEIIRLQSENEQIRKQNLQRANESASLEAKMTQIEFEILKVAPKTKKNDSRSSNAISSKAF